MEQGSTTSLSPNIEDAFGHFTDEVYLSNLDEIIIRINPLELKKL